MYFATQPVEEPANGKEPGAMMNIFDGEDQVLFASDWPHHDLIIRARSSIAALPQG